MVAPRRADHHRGCARRVRRAGRRGCFTPAPSEAFSFALSGGETARACYERLASDAGTQIDWWKVDIYWGDERCVPHDHPDSNYRLAREALLDRVGAANATLPHALRGGRRPYQLRLGELGTLDLIHLGLGPDGHTASLFPNSAALDADPGRLVALNEDPLGRNPHPRMTLTFAGIARGTPGGRHGGRRQARLMRWPRSPAARTCPAGASAPTACSGSWTPLLRSIAGVT